LKNGETVSSMAYCPFKKSVVLGTSEGRILLVKTLGLNGFMMGNRTIYSSATTGAGIESEAAPVNVQYGLIDRIIEITSSREITRWRKFDRPTGIDVTRTSVGMFTTGVLWAGQDFGWWGDLSWAQTIPDGCRVAVQVRVAGTSDAVAGTAWRTFEETTSGTITKSLDELSTAGSYAQMRVLLESADASASPQVTALVLPFMAKHVSYFFTVKMVMEKGSNIRGGMLVGVSSAPANTDVRWGVADSASADWNDYVEVTPGKMFSLPEGFGDRIKVGAKMASYDDECYPSIDEFGLTFESSIDNILGRST